MSCVWCGDALFTQDGKSPLDIAEEKNTKEKYTKVIDLLKWVSLVPLLHSFHVPARHPSVLRYKAYRGVCGAGESAKSIDDISCPAWGASAFPWFVAARTATNNNAYYLHTVARFHCRQGQIFDAADAGDSLALERILINAPVEALTWRLPQARRYVTCLPMSLRLTCHCAMCRHSTRRCTSPPRAGTPNVYSHWSAASMLCSSHSLS
jgi:hypothetical protein